MPIRPEQIEDKFKKIHQEEIDLCCKKLDNMLVAEWDNGPLNITNIVVRHYKVWPKVKAMYEEAGWEIKFETWRNQTEYVINKKKK